MEYQLSIAEATEVFSLPEVINKADVSVDACYALDIALNAKAVQAFVEAYRESREAIPARVSEYGSKVRSTKYKLTGKALADKMQELQREYADAIVAEEERQFGLQKEYHTRKAKFDLTQIPKSAFTGQSSALASIMASLAKTGLLDMEAVDEDREKPAKKAKR